MLQPLGLKRVDTTEQLNNSKRFYRDSVILWVFFFLLLILKESKLHFVSFFDGVQVK